MYKSRFNIINVYAVLLSIVLLFGLGYYCIAYSAELNPGKSTEKSPPFLVGLFLFPVATYLLYKILKNAMRVSIDSDSFSARSVLKKYNFRSSEIQSIELFSRIPQWSFFAGELSDGINIILKDNSTLFLYDKYFRERSQLKQVFKEFADKNKNDTTLIFQRETKKGDTAILNADTEKFGRYYWFLSAMFLLLAFLAGMCYMFNPIIKKGVIWPYELMVGYFLLIYFALSFQANYFIIESNKLIIKNYPLFWVRKEYNIDDIVTVFFIRQYKKSNALRIILSDCSSKTFPAAGLRKKDWIKLKDKLTDSGIEVRSDPSFYVDA